MQEAVTKTDLIDAAQRAAASVLEQAAGRSERREQLGSVVSKIKAIWDGLETKIEGLASQLAASKAETQIAHNALLQAERRHAEEMERVRAEGDAEIARVRSDAEFEINQVKDTAQRELSRIANEAHASVTTANLAMHQARAETLQVQTENNELRQSMGVLISAIENGTRTIREEGQMMDTMLHSLFDDRLTAEDTQEAPENTQDAPLPFQDSNVDVIDALTAELAGYLKTDVAGDQPEDSAEIVRFDRIRAA